jgi:hypothetical protein
MQNQVHYPCGAPGGRGRARGRGRGRGAAAGSSPASAAGHGRSDKDRERHDLQFVAISSLTLWEGGIYRMVVVAVVMMVITIRKGMMVATNTMTMTMPA